jgi:CHAT domain-containing protein
MATARTIRWLFGTTALALGLAVAAPANAKPKTPPVAEDPAKPLIESARAAAAAGKSADVLRIDAEITKLREATPAWVAEKRQAASEVPANKQRAVMMWNRAHQQAIQAANANDVPAAVAAAEQAFSIARDNLGEAHMATLISASDLAALQLRAGRIEAAETNLQAAIKSAETALGAGHPETLKIRYALANFYQVQARYPQVIEVQRANWQAATAALGATHPESLTAAMATARAEINAGHHAEGGKILDSTCGASRMVYGDWHVETSRCLMQQGSVARRRGDFDAAATLFDQARAIQKLVIDDANPLGISTRIGQAEVQQYRGQLAEAQENLEGAIRDATAAHDDGNLWAARSDLVEILDDRGNHDAAETLANDVLKHNTDTLGPNHPDTVASMIALGAVYRKQGRLAEAEKAFDQAYEIYRKVLGEQHASTVIAANNLGEILEKEGIYERAEPYMRGALLGAQKAFGETHPTTLATMNNLGLLYESQGVFDKAEPLYKSVVTILGKAGGPRNPETVASVNNLAYLYLLEGQYDKAAEMFRQVLTAWEKAYGPKHINTLKALNNLARATGKAGHTAEAEKLFDRALAGRRAALGERHMDTLRSMHDLAALYAATGRNDQAQALLEKTLAADEAVLGKAHPYTFETLNTLAAVQTARNESAAALATRHTIFERRNSFLDRVLPVTGDNAREGYVRLHAPELAAYVALLVHQDDATAGKGVLEASLHRKGLLLKVASEIQQIARLSRDPALAQIGDELNAARKKLAALTLSGPTEETRANHLDVIAGLEDRINDLQAEMGRASQRFRQTNAPIGLDDLVKALPADAALVDFFIYGEDGAQKLVAATLTKNGDNPVFGLVRFPDLAAINSAVMKYRGDIQNEEMEFDELMDSGQAVYSLVWKPLETALGGRKTAFVAPDGTLNILPMSALVAKDGKYLIEKVDLHFMGSSRDLLPSLVPPAKGGYFINAGPDYNTDAVIDKDVVEKAKSRSANVEMQQGLRGMSSGMRGLHFDPLPGAEREGQLIVKTISDGGRPVTMFTKGDAQEKMLRSFEEPPEILHIATHGFFLKADDTLRRRLLSMQRSADIQIPPPGDNPLLRAGLAFAGINANAKVLGEIDTDNDGVLTALEVLNLNLTGTKLVILSACETGLGEIHEGEGVYGLRRSFQQAGAGTVVSSLWEVSDAGTQTLMSALYKRLLAGQSPHDALHDAQLEMLHNNQWSAPYIWSAFFMVGG